jgi:hypothetical protein
MNGKRFCFWLPTEKTWIRDLLDERVKTQEAKGLVSSVGNEVVKILEDALRGDLIREDTAAEEHGTGHPE